MVAALGGAGLFRLLQVGQVRIGPRHPVDPSQVTWLSYAQAPGLFLIVCGFLGLCLVLGLYGLWHYRPRPQPPRRRGTRG